MKIGITGRKGFIGSSSAEHLLSQGHQVISLDVYTRQEQKGGSGLTDAKDYPDDLSWVLHFGASTSIPKSLEKPFDTYHNNLNSTLVALHIAHRSDAACIFMSSYVYGVPQYLPIDENHPLAASNPYMGSKIACEDICRQLGKLLYIPVIILRGFHIYGDYHIPGRLISDLLEQNRKGEPLTVNDSAPKRDYLYIKDFYVLLERILAQHPAQSGTYNVGSGQSSSNKDVAEILRLLVHEERALIVKSHRRPHDILECVADIRLIQNTFSWKPAYSLKRGLRELVSQRQTFPES